MSLQQDIDDRLLNGGCQFKGDLRIVTHKTHLEILKLMCERNSVTEIVPILTTILKLYITLPIISCEVKIN